LRPHRGTLILMLGILACGLFPFPAGPLAWLLGHKDLQAMRAGEMDPNGMDLTNYGKRLGMAGTVLGLACCFLSLASFYLFPSPSTLLPQAPNLDDQLRQLLKG